MTNSKESTTDSDFNWNRFNICLGLMVAFIVALVLINISPAFSDEDIPNYNSTTDHTHDHTHDNISENTLFYEITGEKMDPKIKELIVTWVMIAMFVSIIPIMLLFRYSLK